ncbi:MAG: TIGR04086 family membrane protein [Oscillospiraceae bacterium]|nr:TIGR04086 family membrane protein [Oscillospiraceae bacterium]
MKKVKRIAIGVVTAYVAYLALLALIAAFAVRGTLSEKSLNAPVLCAAFAAVFVGAGISQERGKRSAGNAAACAAAFCVTLALIGLIAYDRADIKGAAATLAPAALGAATACSIRKSGTDSRAGRRIRRKVNIKRKTQA